MTKPIEAHEHPIAKIFSDDFVFSIPGYQRPYSWTTDQAQELFDDLISSIPNTNDISNIPSYFLGSVVLIKEANNPNSEVVDGQQRLTTLTILLSVIRNILNSDLKKQIEPLIYEKGNLFLNTKDRFRLTLRDRDREFFQKYIQKDNGISNINEYENYESDSQKNIAKNAAFFLSRLTNISMDRCISLANFIATKCYIVVVSTPNIESAYRIFSVLNSRGLDLSATDILKSQIIGKISVQKRIEYTKKWEDAEERLGRESFNDLFSHIRMVYKKSKPQESLLKEFDALTSATKCPEEFIDNTLMDLSNAYYEIIENDYASTSHASHVNSTLAWLNRLEFADWVPPSLLFLQKNRKSPAGILRYFKELERLAYFMLVTKKGINIRIERFSKITFAIQNKVDLFNSEYSPLQLTPFEQYDFYAALEGDIYENLSARARSTLLLRLDALLSDGSAAYDFKRITVEHVLPQNPGVNSEWIKNFGQIRQRNKYVHILGNLALLSRNKNAQASNFDFNHKKENYFKTKGGVTPFVLTTQILKYSAWTPDVVMSRQAELLGFLENHWRLHDRKNLLDDL